MQVLICRARLFRASFAVISKEAWKNVAETARGPSERTHTNLLDEWVPVLVSAFLFTGCCMPYWIHCDRQAQEGDLRRMQILMTNELSLAEDLRGPFDRPEDACNIAESLIWALVAKILERLRSEKPRRFAIFPLAGETQAESDS